METVKKVWGARGPGRGGGSMEFILLQYKAGVGEVLVVCAEGLGGGVHGSMRCFASIPRWGLMDA